ncbi:hypothetical protein J5X84_27540 [Streptosporangiaceae bacterium NEAU-GS5]|nr:hypothetical protein [Streptosporangiaceae bacterium NEAU-GS5]
MLYPSIRLVSLAGSIAGVALFLAGCGQNAAGTSAKPTASAAGKPVKSDKPVAAGALSAPDEIGSLRKSADQTVATDLLKQIQGGTKATKMIAVSYEDGTDKSHTVLVYGGVGEVPPGSTDDQLKSMLGSGTMVGSKVGEAQTVDPGAAGGAAKCAPIPSNDGLKYVNCGWINGKTALVMTFTGFDAATPQTMVPAIVAAIAP